MPLLAATLQPVMIGEFTAAGLGGVFSIPLVSALSMGIALSIITNTIATQDVGFLGIGVGVGTVTGVTPALLTPTLVGLMTSLGMTGMFSPLLAGAVSNAFCTWFLANIVQTTHPLLGLGSGVGHVLGLIPSAMQAQIVGFMTANGIAGPMNILLAQAVATAICTTVMTSGIATVVIAGPPIPPPPVGPIPGVGTGVGIMF